MSPWNFFLKRSKPKPRTSGYCIGIDFGTSKSMMAYITYIASTDGPTTSKTPTPEPELAHIDTATLTIMPSAVLLGENLKFIGSEAVNNASERDPAHGFFTHFKLDLGLADEELPPGYDQYKVRPVHLVYLLLETLKRQAEKNNFNNITLRQAILTVPANWDRKSRYETLLAAKAAGFEDVEFIDEPYAALLSLDHRLRFLDDGQIHNYLVVDYGGGTCDVAVCTTFGGYDHSPDIVEATLANCGGKNLDVAFANLLINKVGNQFEVDEAELRTQYGKQVEHEAQKLKENFVNWLRNGAESGSYPAKIHCMTRLNWEQKNKFEAVLVHITPAEFDRALCREILRIREPICSALHLAKKSPSEIDRVFLVGGSSLIPLVKRVVERIFPEDAMWRSREVSGKNEQYHSRVNVQPEARQHVVFGAALRELYKLQKAPQYNANPRWHLHLALEVTRPDRSKEFQTLIHAGTSFEQASQRQRVYCGTPFADMEELTFRIVVLDSEHKSQQPVEPLKYAVKTLKFGKKLPVNAPLIIEYFVDARKMFILEAWLEEEGKPNQKGKFIRIEGPDTEINTEDIIRIRNRFQPDGILLENSNE